MNRESSGPQRPQLRRPPSKAANTCIDASLEDQRRAADENKALGSGRAKPVALDGIHTGPDDAPRTRPAPQGKPQFYYSNSAGNAPETAPQASATPTLPVPPRPGHCRLGHASQQQRIVPGGTGVKGNAVTVAPSDDPPPPAPQFPGGKTADFFPWTGNHAEDVLTEALVKTGVSNKCQIMPETHTARNSLFPNLKNKAGIPTLSSLFVAVLEKRQACGRLTAPHNFKPPPRLTLRDSTRETWLHDLANPSVGLRRLSRTIPHGITGTVLLDHCLRKHIPLPRAVWLAKCVGINEMRSHKRKGQAGTITWVRGWTSAVEQFLDRTVASVGQEEWKPRITYALQLATSLYKDHLLEEDHFLDWILKNLESCPPERLFIWLLIASLYGPELTASRRRGKRLAESLLNHTEKLYRLDEESHVSPLLQHLEKVLIKLVLTSPGSLLLPKTWDANFSVLRRLATRHPHAQITSIIEHLDRRARRLLSQPRCASSNTQDSTRTLITLLDSVDYAVSLNVDHLASECLALMPDSQSLILVVLNWASSFHRDGLHRVYLVTRMLRKWGHLGVDIDTAILSYFRSLDSVTGCDLCIVFRIVAELVRSKTFSVGKYLQWLIATGSIRKDQDPCSPSSSPLRLITEIPLTGLSEQVRNLRSTLLRGTAYSTEEEDKCLNDAESFMRCRLKGLFGAEMSDKMPHIVSISELSSTVRLELAFLLRHQVAATVEMMDHVPTKDPSVEERGPICTITPRDFHSVRSYLEEFGDLSILADIIGIVTTSLDTAILASAADTLHYHHKSFRAIGAFDSLFGKIAMRYAVIRTVRFPERELLLSLINLSTTAQTNGKLLQALTHDLSRYDQINSVAACSPVSDTMAEVNHHTARDSDEDIERILSSGTSMDQQVMDRVFNKIIVYLETQIKTGSPPSGNLAIWLPRLRCFDEAAFETILTEWLATLLTSHHTKLAHAILPALVNSGCFTMSKLLVIAEGCITKRKTSSHEEALRISVEMLDILLPSEQLSPLCQLQEAYRYRLAQQNFCQDPEEHILHFIRETLELCAKSLSPGSQMRVTTFVSSDRMRTIIRYFALRDIQSLAIALGIGTHPFSDTMRSTIKALLDRLLDPPDRLLLSAKSLEQQVNTVVESADYLSLPFCQLEIRYMVSMGVADSESSFDTMSGALLEAVKAAVGNDQSPWPDLVTGLDASLTDKIHEHAEQELLMASSCISSQTALAHSWSERDDGAFIRRYLALLNYTASNTEKANQAPVFTTLVDRFRSVADILGKIGDLPNQSNQQSTLSSPMFFLDSWLNALLRLAAAHGSVPLQKVSSQHQAALLWSLRLLFTHPILESYPSIAEHAFDVALLFSDSVSDDVRNHLAKLDTAKSSGDARCVFLFGSNPSTDGWLVVAKMVPSSAIPATAGISSQPRTQSQQTNQVQPQHQQQQYQNPPPQCSTPVSMQRSLSQQHQEQLQAQAQALNANRMYPQYPQHPPSNSANINVLSQFQRTAGAPGTGSQQSQLRQMQQMQQMQSLAQQRMAQPSLVQMQRHAAPPPQAQHNGQGGIGKASSGSGMKQEMEIRTVPFALKRWEILPESGGNPASNETAISLSLFGARKV